MNSILFLDDNTERIIKTIKVFNNGTDILYPVFTVEQCISLLKYLSEWDTVSLDHDLEGEVFVDSKREDCGMEVVRWIIINKPKIKQILIHSWNLEAAKEMERKLKDAGYSVFRIPFPL